jgi:hypothetical protein
LIHVFQILDVGNDSHGGFLQIGRIILPIQR